MKLKYISFYFENCDMITIDGKYIGAFLVDDIKQYIARIASNSIDKIEIAQTFAIEIHKDANKERYQFYQSQIPKFKHMTFDRLNTTHDITQIEFELFDDYAEPEEREIPCTECYYYSVSWLGDKDEINEAQKSYISKDGNLYIVISKEKGIEDFFDKKCIDDSVEMDVHFDLCNVGDVYGNPDRYKED